MKLMNVLLVFGLVGNTHSMNHEFLMKAKTAWHYFTPKAQQQLKDLCTTDNFTIVLHNIDPKLLLIINPSLICKNEADEKAFYTKRFTFPQNIIESLTQTNRCNQLFKQLSSDLLVETERTSLCRCNDLANVREMLKALKMGANLDGHYN